MRRIDGVPRLLRCLFIYLMRNYVNQSHPLKFNKGHDCGMPVRRLKSCVHCRRAKARCSLATPCLRCATRHLDCHYTSTQPRPTNHYRAEGFRPIRPAAEHSAKNAPFETEAAGSASLAPSQGPSLAPEAVSTTDFTGLVTTGTDSPEYDLEACTNSSLDWFGQSNTYNLLLEDESESHGWQPTSDTDTLACFSFEDLLASPYNSTLEFPTVSSRDTNFFSAHDEMTYTSPDSRGQAPATKSPGPQLVQRTRSLIQGSLTAKMLFSRLCDYTRMMADAKTLPPFIYPPCYLGPNDECTPETSHQCLPEALAVCANLSRMFYSRTRESPNFIWQRICTHLRQMKKEYEGYGEEKKLQALQAALVYGIICAQSMESIPNEDAAWMVEIIETFAERLYDMRTWGLDEDSVFTSRGRWTFVESLRRIGCLLYLIDLLLHLDTETPSSGDCPEFFDMPLPCVRELWEPMPTREWKKRHRDHVESAKRKGRRGLTLRHLFLLRQSSSKGQHQDFSQSNSPDFEEELSEWCEKADDLSMLLWVALTVEGKGQSYV